MTKEEAYKIFIDEIASGDDKLKVVAEHNVMMPIAFNCAWAMASDNQRQIDTFKGCEWLKRELAEPMPDECYKQWCAEKLEDFQKAMKGE